MNRFLLATFTTLLLASPAMADRASYCQAYARDFADQRATEKLLWQHKYQIALDACLTPQNAKPEPVVEEKPAAKPKAVKPIPKKVETKPEVKAAEKTGTKPQLAAGSPEWLDYCEKKYVSFDVKKGTYLSKTGVVRRCLVTAD